MRFAALVLAWLGAGGLTLAAADPAPTTPPERVAPAAAVVTESAAPAKAVAAEAAAAPAAASPAAGQPVAPKSAAAAPLSAEERRLLNQGYKPQMRNGEKIYCRREAELGSRIGGVQHCGTVQQLSTATRDGRDYTEEAQRIQNNPMGN